MYVCAYVGEKGGSSVPGIHEGTGPRVVLSLTGKRERIAHCRYDIGTFIGYLGRWIHSNRSMIYRWGRSINNHYKLFFSFEKAVMKCCTGLTRKGTRKKEPKKWHKNRAYPLPPRWFEFARKLGVIPRRSVGSSELTSPTRRNSSLLELKREWGLFR